LQCGVLTARHFNCLTINFTAAAAWATSAARHEASLGGALFPYVLPGNLKARWLRRRAFF
jgi:hypothetical protein